MKKKILFVVIIIIVLILLIPRPIKLKDGGSIEYKAILYTVTKYHSMAPTHANQQTQYIEGIGIEILGIEVYKNTNEDEFDFISDSNVDNDDLNIDNDNLNEERNIIDSNKIQTALTLEDEIQNNTIWCGTFQLIWNDLKDQLVKQDIVFNPQLKVVENLNKETFKTSDISDKYYYKKLGNISIELKEEIEKAIKDKFNEESDILDDFNWQDKGYFLYAMLKKEFQFESEFEEFEKGNFGKYQNVEYFGIRKDETGELRNQVKVLYYNSKEDFAIKLKTKQEDEVILCKNPEGRTFNEIYTNILKQQETYSKSKTLQEGEKLKIPNIKIDEKEEFTEIEDKAFSFSNGDKYSIEKAIQTIKFELDKTGGKIKSEAAISAKNSEPIIAQESREFILDNTFAIFLIEEGKNTPYFAGKIEDITKFQ